MFLLEKILVKSTIHIYEHCAHFPLYSVQLLAYDTVNKCLSSKPGEQRKVPVPPSLIAGACAGVSSTILTYPLELVKTRLTIQVIQLSYTFTPL